MKKIIAISSAALLISSCITRDNPLDIKGDTYVAPTFYVKAFPADGVILGTTFPFEMVESSALVYSYSLAGAIYTDWKSWQLSMGSLTAGVYSLHDGVHELIIKGDYPSLSSPVIYPLTFSLVTDTNSLYLSPAVVETEDPMLTLNGYQFKDTLTSLHIELSEGTIDSVKLKDENSFVKALSSGKVLDISVLPGGTPITGSSAIVDLYISGLTTGKILDFTAIGETKSGKSVTINSRVSTLVK